MTCTLNCLGKDVYTTFDVVEYTVTDSNTYVTVIDCFGELCVVKLPQYVYCVSFTYNYPNFVIDETYDNYCELVKLFHDTMFKEDNHG